MKSDSSSSIISISNYMALIIDYVPIIRRVKLYYKIITKSLEAQKNLGLSVSELESQITSFDNDTNLLMSNLEEIKTLSSFHNIDTINELVKLDQETTEFIECINSLEEYFESSNKLGISNVMNYMHQSRDLFSTFQEIGVKFNSVVRDPSKVTDTDLYKFMYESTNDTLLRESILQSIVSLDKKNEKLDLLDFP